MLPSVRDRNDGPIGQDEAFPGFVGLQGLLLVVLLEQGASPLEQVGIGSPEIFPGVSFGQFGRTLTNDGQVEPGDGLVILVVVSVMRGECLDLRGDIFDCTRRSILVDMDPGQAQVRLMREEDRVKGELSKLLFEFLIGQISVRH